MIGTLTLSSAALLLVTTAALAAPPVEDIGKRHPNLAAAPLAGDPGACVIHQDPPHDDGGGLEEMRCILPVRLRPLHEPDIGLMDQARGLQRMAMRLVA